MLHIAYFIIVTGTITKFLLFQKFSIFDLWRVENCLRSLCTHQMPLNHLQTAFPLHSAAPPRRESTPSNTHTK